MKKALLALMCLVAMMAAGTSLKAQEVTIVLNPGWNWISYPSTDTMDIATAFGSFTPEVGDIFKSKWGMTTYIGNGQWRGSLSPVFYPGYGYHYKSNRTTPVFLTFNVQQPTPQVVVTTSEPTDITTSSATCGGNVASSSGDYVFVFLKGICWSINPNPTFNDNYIEAGNGLGSFTVSMTELTPNTTFYVRAFAVTPTGTFYGEEVDFATPPVGAINSLFSINANGAQVYFSQGNLQYQASTNTWRFAVNQYDFIGSANGNISSTYSDYIDLFGWATSGWNNENTYYHPWDSDNSDGSLYGPPGQYNLTGSYANADWGIYNPINNGGNIVNQWRTLTKNEWHWVLFNRNTTSGIRYAKAQVSGVKGLVLLPDDWNSSTYSLNSTNTNNASYSSNVISASQWGILEQAGAVFLPASGKRDKKSVYYYSGYSTSVLGYYWSATQNNSVGAYYTFFSDDSVGTAYGYYYDRYFGYSVRLVHNAE